MNKELQKFNKRMQAIESKTNYYNDLWESLSYAELLSMRLSNRFSRDLLRHYKLYIIFRSMKESIPIIAIVCIAAIITKAVKEAIEGD